MRPSASELTFDLYRFAKALGTELRLLRQFDVCNPDPATTAPHHHRWLGHLPADPANKTVTRRPLL